MFIVVHGMMIVLADSLHLITSIAYIPLWQHVLSFHREQEIEERKKIIFFKTKKQQHINGGKKRKEKKDWFIHLLISTS